MNFNFSRTSKLLRKQILFSLLIIVGFYSCKTSIPVENIDSKDYLIDDVNYIRKNVSHGILRASEVKSLKTYLDTNFDVNLDSINYINIAYLKPRSECWYDNYSHVNTESFKEFVINTKAKSNTQLLFLHYDDGHGNGLDINHFIYNLFPRGHGNTFCDYTVTISSTGEFLFQVGHFEITVANALRNELELYEKNKQK